MSDIKRIGFIGMGNMGVPMAANLVRAGYTVTAYDIVAGRAKDVGIAAGLAGAVDGNTPIVRLISELWANARDGLGGDVDHSRPATYWDRSATSM